MMIERQNGGFEVTNYQPKKDSKKAKSIINIITS